MDEAEETPDDDTAAGEPGEVIWFPRVDHPDSATAERDDAPLPDRPLWRDAVGNVLREERLAQQRTLAEVAEGASVSLPYLSEIERGRKEVSSDVLDAVIRSLGIELPDVLERAAHQIRVRRAAIDISPQLLAA